MSNLVELHNFWFATGTAWEDLGKLHRWFIPDPELDKEIIEKFSELHAQVVEQSLPPLMQLDATQAVGFILAADQLPRNIHRGTPQAFATDHIALAATQELITSKRIEQLEPAPRLFALMPLQHAEDLEVQEQSLQQYQLMQTQAPAAQQEMMEKTVDSAKQHHGIIEKFGRFPYRNAILERENTPEEEEFLADKDSPSFGQSKA